MTKLLVAFLLLCAVTLFGVGCSSDASKSGEQAQAGDYKASPKAPPGKTQ